VRGGSRRTWKSFVAVVVIWRRLRNDGRVAVTTMRAAPDWSEGTVCLPSGPVIRRVLRSTFVTSTPAGGPGGNFSPRSAANRSTSGTLFPFWSRVIVSAVNFAFGACAVTSTPPVCPIGRSGLLIVSCGGGLGAGPNQAPAGGGARNTTTPPSPRDINSNLQDW